MHRRTTAALALTTAAALAQATPPRNVIVFIADGCGETAHRAFEHYRGEPMLYLGDQWERYAVATYALRSGSRPHSRDPLEQDDRLVYDPAKAWDTTPIAGGSGRYPFLFAGYRWLRATAPDSANTATAIFTGVPTYQGAINVNGAAEPLTTATMIASDRGVAVGIATSVGFSHATPACAAGAQTPSRDMYHEITRQMLANGVCDVIAGPGHPAYDTNANPRESMDYKFIGPDEWQALSTGAATHKNGQTWTLVEDTDSIKALAQGDTPSPLFIMPTVANTLQQERHPLIARDATPPGGHPRTPGLPTLTDLALATLNAIDDDPDGFFLTIEGGAVDWAMHDNQIGRMIEEMGEFHDAIEAVCEILDAGDRGYDWSDTLVVVTADHDHMLLGPESDTIPFQPLTDNGPGELPGFRWHSDSHSNLPVPLFVRGAGTDRFARIPTQPNTHTAPDGTRFDRTPYFRQTELGKLLIELVSPHPLSESNAE